MISNQTSSLPYTVSTNPPLPYTCGTATRPLLYAVSTDVSLQFCTVGTEIIYTQLQVNIECHG